MTTAVPSTALATIQPAFTDARSSSFRPTPTPVWRAASRAIPGTLR